MTGRFDIYVIGVGGQGIGLLSEVLMRAIDHAGHPVRAVDTHGLAQRGGTVESHVRMGAGVHTPLIQRGKAHLVVALEIHEALRGAETYLAEGGTLVYYAASWQPLGVRLKQAEAVADADIESAGREKQASVVRVHKEALSDPRMQNTVLLSEIARRNLVPGVNAEHYERALADMLGGDALTKNLALFRDDR
ncbi:2-oxoacid:acceptor oxidoreductase family protein [bacterium]|nr:2-oxoacid:acceptor oxidoreductase family protein [candidate division CSSED10-310 bacterium]